MMKLTVAAVVACATAAGITQAQTQPAEERGGAPRTITVQMQNTDGAYVFSPAEVKARNGDRIEFVMVSGGPHNVAFDPERVPANAKAALSRVLPNRMSELAGPLLTEAGAKYGVVLNGVPPGRYPFYCMPHMGVAMTGTLIVE